jgi:murein DD-endopeptidase MepM/ murein hydrolase activator NlpD
MFSSESIRKFFAATVAFAVVFALPLTAKASYLDDLLNQKKEQDQAIQDTERQLNDKQSQIDTYTNEIDQKNASIAAIEKKIAETEKQIADVQKEIEKLAKEIKKNREEYEIKKNALFESIRLLYETGTKTTLEVMVSAQDLSTLQRLATYNQDMQNNVNSAMKELDRVKKELDQKQANQEKKKKELEDLKSKQDQEKKDLEIQRADKAALLELAKKDKSALEELKKRQEAEEASINNAITEYFANNPQGPSQYTGPVNNGFFGSPLPWDPPRLSSPCGDYMSPCYGGPHPGVDLAAPQGTPVYASAGGRVMVAVRTGSSALQYVAIDHLNGYYTYYLHLSEVWVNVNQSVSKGTVIGLSGGTPGTIGAGWTTGAHLHFQINIGSTNYYAGVNPHDYLIILPWGY